MAAEQSSSFPELQDKSALVVMCKADNLKAESALDIVRSNEVLDSRRDFRR